MRKLLIFITFTIFYLNGIAQISRGGKPFFLDKQNSSNRYKSLNKNAILESNAIILSTIDNDSLASIYQSSSSKKEYVGVIRDINFSFKDEADLLKLDDGSCLWRKMIISQNAKALGVMFKNLHLIEGAKLFIYSDDYKHILGSFTYENNKQDKYFSVDEIPTDRVIIELYEPKQVVGKSTLIIDKIVHHFKSGYKESGLCNNDLKADEEIWINAARSVVKLTIRSGRSAWLCSGVIVNDAKNSQSPFVLTAKHCFRDEGNTTDAQVNYRASNLITKFNYQEIGVEFTENNPNQSITGSELIASSDNLDFALLVLSDTIPTNFNPLFAGINLSKDSELPSIERACIHHPNGDIKKISYTYDKLTTFTYTGEDLKLDPFSHWKAVWTSGVTEGGSSGSPLFDENFRVLGLLSGGASGCDGTEMQEGTNLDLFTKMGLCWDKKTNENQQLKKWLDPQNTNYGNIPAFDPNSKTTIDQNALDNSISKPRIRLKKNKRMVVDFNTNKFFSYHVNIYNNMGTLMKKMSSRNQGEYNEEIDINNLRSGIYFIQTTTIYGNFISKIYIN
jgi:V8-like Glu-specific endopeptidase